MSNKKLALAQTDIDNLLANLRGEVGEVITSWLLARRFIVAARQLRNDNPEEDLSNKNLQFVNLMADKLCDELVGRLSELAERKIGQLTFYFAARKLSALLDDVSRFEKFIIGSHIRDKRNRDVSHKELPGAKGQRAYLHIPYRTLVRAAALALRLMKKIDRIALGPAAPFLWREARKRRYEFLSPPRAGYMLVPYLNLPPEDRIKVVLLEQAEGKQVWSEMPTQVDGKSATVLACRRWGVIAVGGKVLALSRYPLVELQGLSLSGADQEADIAQG